MELVTTVYDVEDYEYIEFERLGGEVRVYLNGELLGDNVRWYGRQSRTNNRPYRFYGNFKKGGNEIKLVIKYEEYDLPVVSGYVKVAKTVKEPWRVALHYGKARVFVKADTELDLHLN